MFPSELWDVIDPTGGPGSYKADEFKKLTLANPELKNLSDEEISGDGDPESGEGEKIDEADNAGDKDKGKTKDDDEGMEEPVDDDYDDEDEGGDYDAEQYFDDGEDDEGDDYDGGEEGGGDDYY